MIQLLPYENSGILTSSGVTGGASNSLQLTTIDNTTQNCILYPSYPYITIPNNITYVYSSPQIDYVDIQIRQVKNGWICNMRGTEYVFESLDSMNKAIKEFYKEKK